MRVPEFHGREKILRIVAEGTPGVAEPGENTCEFRDVRVVVSWNRLTLRIYLSGSIGVKFPETN